MPFGYIAMTDTPTVFDCLQDCFEAISEDELRTLEEDLHVTFPKDYRRFLLTYNAAHAKHPIAFRVRTPTRWIDEANVVDTLGIVADKRFDDSDIRWKVECFEDSIPEDVIPIMRGYNTLICMGTSPEYYGKIYVWDWSDAEDDDCVHFVADSFAQFLTRLYRESEEEFYLEELPIFQAVEQGRLAAVGEYLADGGKLECRNEQGHTMLMCAARSCWPKIVRLLLEHGADPNAQDVADYPPMYHAILNHTVDSCKLRLAAGADGRWCDDRGLTLYKIAWENASFRIAYTLEEHLAKP